MENCPHIPLNCKLLKWLSFGRNWHSSWKPGKFSSGFLMCAFLIVEVALSQSTFPLWWSPEARHFSSFRLLVTHMCLRMKWHFLLWKCAIGSFVFSGPHALVQDSPLFLVHAFSTHSNKSKLKGDDAWEMVSWGEEKWPLQACYLQGPQVSTPILLFGVGWYFFQLPHFCSSQLFCFWTD